MINPIAIGKSCCIRACNVNFLAPHLNPLDSSGIFRPFNQASFKRRQAELKRYRRWRAHGAAQPMEPSPAGLWSKACDLAPLGVCCLVLGRWGRPWRRWRAFFVTCEHVTRSRVSGHGTAPKTLLAWRSIVLPCVCFLARCVRGRHRPQQGMSGTCAHTHADTRGQCAPSPRITPRAHFKNAHRMIGS